MKELLTSIVFEMLDVGTSNSLSFLKFEILKLLKFGNFEIL